MQQTLEMVSRTSLIAGTTTRTVIIVLAENTDSLAGSIDLLQAITLPFEDPKHIYFAEDAQGLPAFGVRAGSTIRTPFGLLFPEKELFAEFLITAHVKPADEQVHNELSHLASGTVIKMTT